MINLEVKIPDTPGSLIELIKPISTYGGNIFGIFHHHDKKINNMIPVNITFELSEELLDTGLEKIKTTLRQKNIEIINVTKGIERKQLVVILTGHVFDTDVLDTIKRLAKSNIKVSELEAKFTEIEDISNVKFKLEIPESTTEEKVIEELNKICEDKNLSLIRA